MPSLKRTRSGMTPIVEGNSAFRVESPCELHVTLGPQNGASRTLPKRSKTPLAGKPAILMVVVAPSSMSVQVRRLSGSAEGGGQAVSAII
jgi:hypothetical protein